MIREQIVQRYAQELAEMDRASFEDWVAAKTQELEVQASQFQTDNQGPTIAAWTSAMGREPDYMERLGLINQTRLAAIEWVTHQLWEGYQDPDDAEPEPSSETPIPVAAMDRWTTEAGTEPDRETEQVVEMVWPDRTPAFQVTAELLLAARAEDGLALPVGPDDPLAGELAVAVEQEMARSNAALAEHGLKPSL
ncbi:hypothetical protein [Williamsia sp.]|uniref:hypothetical protein n=1 Tax=Williamsia sp. TaxID=1872085 RepID=UPI001A1F1B59|nr:hypothetical protein [Williamsia sp.]MBJ7287578.1 hypothetical protein [Williamsia sp.]